MQFARFEDPSDEAEEILVRWFDARAEGSDQSFDDLLRAHPDRADELRARVSALEDLLGELPDARDAALPERLGPFRLGARLGGGGMGVVVAAHDEELGRDVAVKIVRPDLLFLGKARARFRREVEAVARLEHPGIVPVLSVGEESGLPWFAMERVRGVSLAEVVRALDGRAPESLTGADLARVVGADEEGEESAEAPPAWRGSWVDACLDLARQVAAALHHAHARGVIHRDVKPSNVMVTPDGRARLIDFGLTAAEGSESLTRSGAALGTLLYMAPEQVRGDRDADARADVYGLGATLYELLALQPHVLGNGPVEVQRRIVTGEVEPLRARNRSVAADVDTVVRKALDV
ncbi:MAG: serine/threonine-protein kinase, partial [Planctomycetota bacterium JB042]